ncbi:KI13B protein, partial [Acromyrmex insinuator]
MTEQQTILQHPTTMDKIDRNKPKTFAFDHCFYSLDPGADNFASQEIVFDALGRDILDNAFQGYNACIFAYGQTGSGKSYTMMGSGDNKGIIPRLCDNLFDMIAKQQSSELSYKVEVSYMEIYNEKVHDLLDPKPNKQSLKVREHNVLGPYVDGLSQLAVTSFQDIDNLMAEGNKSRTVAATNMNSESSRSHAVFSVILTQTLTDSKSGVSGEKVSRMSLVDLAGSERAVKTGAVGDRLKEGSNINKSLTTLGLVISKLADQNSGSNKKKDNFVPYRDSVLTWLLKDNLGGNSKTVMVATISPAADNYEETLSTLRYADRAKRIVNHAVVNEDPNARIIRELRQEVETLKEMLLHATGSIVGQQRTDITEKLSESERLMKEMSQTWEEKLVKTERLQHERQQALEKMGISVQASGIQVEKNKYYLVNLNDDPSLNELLVYYLKERTLVGGRSAKREQDIQLHGLGILPEHCVITIEESGLYMTPLNGARCFVNGTQVVNKTLLQHGDRIVWGNHHFFRVNCPRSATEGALSIEVWGHRSAGFSRSKPGWEVEQQQLAKARSLADRWSELTRKIELWVEIQELNEQGEYSPVEVAVKQDTCTGGIYQLRQGQQRRIQVRVKPVQNSGTLPIICQSILNIAVGSVSVRNRLQIPLDSYQDEDLSILRDKWSDALMRRRQYLDQQIQKLINKQDKTEQDMEREQSLVDQWVSLTEERNAVLVPAAGSGIPGAPADWTPPAGMEPHIPVLFLDLNADDLSTHQSGEEVSVTGLNSILPKEHGNKFYNLPIIRHLEKDVCAIAAWDSSIHDNVHLNRVTDTGNYPLRFSKKLVIRMFLILKTTVRLSHPAPMDLVLRKRLALNIYKRQSITDRIFKRIVRNDCLTQTGVTYEVVSNIPKASEELEDRESLAQIAASGEDNSLCDGETYIEKYTRGVSAVESILTLDRLRQSVAIKELLQAQGQPLMRKTASVPNFSQIMRFDMSMDSLNVTRSESVTDLNMENGLPHPRRASTGHTRNDENFISVPPKPFGIARPTFLNLNLNLNSLTRLQQSTSAKSSPNMVSSKLGPRMTTLHEETSNMGNQACTPINDDDEEKSDADYSEYEAYQAPPKPVKPLTSSRTLDSLVELQSTKINTPSMSSSGYGSQAVSTTNLTSEDSISIKSISVDETPDLEYRNLLDSKKPEKMDSSLVEETPEEYLSEVNSTLDNLNISQSARTEGQLSQMQNSHFRYRYYSVVNTFYLIEHTKKNLEEIGTYIDTDIDSPVSSTKSESETNSNMFHVETQRKSTPNQILSDRKNEMEISQMSNSGDDSPMEGTSIVHTKLPPGKVVRRRKTSNGSGRPTSSQHRASFPMVRPQLSESKAAVHLEQTLQPTMPYENGDNSSSERIDADDVSDKSSAFGSRHDLTRVETPLPDWIVVGESVLVRPYSYSGVIAYVGPTEFASGIWIGVELDAPTGKNDGAVNGHRYFTCRPKCGIFVKMDKLIQDRRGRALRSYTKQESTPAPSTSMRRSISKGEGLHSLHRSRSRGEGLSTTGTRSFPRGK